jgi:NifB/MoaA-like Fe-S oxidoreductase
MLNERQKTEFFFNIHDTNSIITGGRTTGGYYCPVNCVFCMCKGDNPDIDSKIPFIEMEELKEGLRFINWKNKQVYLGDGISKLSAEAFAHPKIYDILDYTCKNLPDHEITIMTTGIMIREDKINYLNSLKNLIISISVNTLQEAERKKIMPHPETEKVKILINRLERVGVQLLDMGSVDILKADLTDIYSLKKIEKFQLRRIEHSKFHTEEVVDLSKKSISNYENSLLYVQKSYPQSTYWTPYLRYDLKNSSKLTGIYSYLSSVCNFLSNHKDKKYLFCSAESSYDLWSIWLRGIENVSVCEVKNNTYGGSITVAGLLTFEDVAETIKKTNITGISGLLLPKIMLNSAFTDLNGTTIIDFEKKVGLFPTII